MPKFVDPLDEEADAAEASIVGKNGTALRERMSEAKEDETSEVIVREPDEDEDAEESDTAPAVSRRDKRAGRVSARERAAAAEARAEAYKEALTLSGRQQGPERQQQGDPVAEINGRIRANFDAQEALHDEWIAKQGRMSKDEERRLKDRAIDLSVENTSLVAERRDVLTAPRRESEAQLAELRRAHQDVFDNPAALRYAQGIWNAKQARGEPGTRDVVDSAFEEARSVILGKRPKPDAIQRQRVSSMSPGMRNSQADEPVKLSMPRGSPLYRMAISMYPDLEPAQACQKWAQKNGKAFRESTKGRG